MSKKFLAKDTLAIDITGFETLKKNIIALGNDKDKKREALLLLKQLAKPSLNTAKRTVPIGKSKSNIKSRRSYVGGNLKKSLNIITATRSKNPTVVVGPKTYKQGKKRKTGAADGWYGFIVHEGRNVYRKGYKRDRGGKKYLELAQRKNAKATRKRIPGQPYLAEAYNQTEGKITADAEKKFAQFIQRRINKFSK